MTIAPAILKHYPDLNPAQRRIVAHDEGPLLVIAGPGSGKTYSIVLRALNLLLLGKAAPKEIILCTFTEKAAFEMRDRLSAAAREVGYRGNLSDLQVSTIHGLCNRIIVQHRNWTDLGNGYETLDELTQLLFIHEHFDDIVGPATDGLYLSHWKTRWTAIEGACGYFEKITEELIDAVALLESCDAFLQGIGRSYQAYEAALVASNRTDFSHLQSIVVGLLADRRYGANLTKEVRYVLVDEYQDTNYVQEQVLLRLTAKTHNLCVVGDEDQSLYRFRGATVRNILEFPSRFPACRVIRLTTNYRSHPAIIEAYDRWMASIDWSNPDGLPFRFKKKIEPDPNGSPPDYPGVISIWGSDADSEARRFADFIAFLKQSAVIEDYSQVALLLYSVREKHSGPYLAALKARGIPAFCPRARAYFDNDEVRLMVGCFALIFGWYGDGRGSVTGSVAELAAYVDEAIVELTKTYSAPHPLAQSLQAWVTEIAALEEGESLDLRPADYFYRLLALRPFAKALSDDNVAHNLATFSQLLNTFQNYYHFTVITHHNRESLRFSLFRSFLRLLYDGGINNYEDPDIPFPPGHVQVMTIHQAKGLEFPIVVVGSLSSQSSSSKQLDRVLGSYYKRPPFEPESRITLFDRMRLHYVAFSRSQKVLVLTAHEEPKAHFATIWQGLPQWPRVQKKLLAAQHFALHERMPVKRSFSFTGDLRIYETCPRQYQFFREYDFTPSRSAVIFFGLLVHETIEEIHRIVLDGGLDTLEEGRIHELFDRTFRFLSLSDVRPIGDAARAAAFTQVINYFRQNRAEMRRVIQTEVDVSLEKDDYILTGKIDLLLGGDGKLELLDFKTAPRPIDNATLLDTYERQLCTYAHILERRYGQHVDRMLLYWTAEPEKDKALMAFPYRPERIDEAAAAFDNLVRRIRAKDYRITKPPAGSICEECDLRPLCGTAGSMAT